MKVKLLNYTPLEVADIAICKCYGNEPHSDSEKIKTRINRVANVSKHASTIEHLYYNFDIDGISRACLQEVARHRVASYTVKSSRYTLQELKKEEPFVSIKHNIVPGIMGVPAPTDEQSKRAYNYIVKSDSHFVNNSNILALEGLRGCLQHNIPNDIAKYCMPEAYKTSLVMSINARSLQNFLELRTSKHALKEIQKLARNMFEALPDDHKFLFEGYINNLLQTAIAMQELIQGDK